MIPGAITQLCPTLIPVPGKPLGRHRLTNRRAVCRMARPRRSVLSVAWAPNVVANLDQGDLGSCTGNAAAQVLSTQPYRGLLTEADAVKIYSRATEDDSFPGTYPPADTGSTGPFAAQAARELGYASGGFVVADNLTAALSCLQTRPGMWGSDWYDTFDEPDANGRVRLTSSSVARGGHEYELLACDTDARLVWFRNSWAKYGVVYLNATGCFCMSWDDAANLIDSDGDATFFD